MEEKTLTGYPSIDKPWLKYYSEEAINALMPSANIFDYIWEHNKEHLEDIALVYFRKRITYGELFENIDKATAAFQANGVKSGDVVSIISITPPEFVYCVYALKRIGAIVNMLDPRWSEHTLISQITKADSKILIILDQCSKILVSLEQHLHFEQTILLQVKESMGFPIKQIFSLKTALSKSANSSLNSKCVDWNTFLTLGSQAKVSLSASKADKPAFIWYTGGTTGEAKGVLLSNLNVNSVAEQYRLISKEHFRQQTWLTVSAPFIAYSLICGLHLPLAYGMICCIELYYPTKIAKTIVKKRYNHAAVTPIVWENIIKNPKAQTKDFSFLIAPTSGADYMSPKLECEINNFFDTHNCSWKICQGYGMTEAASGVAICSSNACYKPGSVGIPFPHTVISTFKVDEEEVELPTGEVGEICICSPSVMMEYFKNPEATDAVIKQHSDGKRWMHTGDLGRIDVDGNLFITGRIKRMITRYDGFKVFPSAVEEKILTHQAVEKCCVVGQKDPRSEGGKLPVAFVVLKNNTTPEEDIIQEIQVSYISDLPEYSRPVRFYVKDTLPLTAACKIDYRALEQMADELEKKAHD